MRKIAICWICLVSFAPVIPVMAGVTISMNLKEGSKYLVGEPVVGVITIEGNSPAAFSVGGSESVNKVVWCMTRDSVPLKPLKEIPLAFDIQKGKQSKSNPVPLVNLHKYFDLKKPGVYRVHPILKLSGEKISDKFECVFNVLDEGDGLLQSDLQLFPRESRITKRYLKLVKMCRRSNNELYLLARDEGTGPYDWKPYFVDWCGNGSFEFASDDDGEDFVAVRYSRPNPKVKELDYYVKVFCSTPERIEECGRVRKPREGAEAWEFSSKPFKKKWRILFPHEWSKFIK